MANARTRVMDRNSLAERLDSERKGRTIVFTNGVFDILHVGHARYLEDAAALGDILIVGINSDASVRRLKGEKRPIVPDGERAELIAALRCVDYVTIFGEDTPIETIELLRPDIHVKGGDYDPEAMPETPAVRRHGGRVVCVPFVEGRSSTDIVTTIVERYR